jgi:hypothetical protein
VTPSPEDHSGPDGGLDPDEADRESFPASDAPSGWAGRDPHDSIERDADSTDEEGSPGDEDPAPE